MDSLHVHWESVNLISLFMLIWLPFIDNFHCLYNLLKIKLIKLIHRVLHYSTPKGSRRDPDTPPYLKSTLILGVYHYLTTEGKIADPDPYPKCSIIFMVLYYLIPDLKERDPTITILNTASFLAEGLSLPHPRGERETPRTPHSSYSFWEAQGSISSMQRDYLGLSLPHPRGEMERPWTPTILNPASFLESFFHSPPHQRRKGTTLVYLS